MMTRERCLAAVSAQVWLVIESWDRFNKSSDNTDEQDDALDLLEIHNRGLADFIAKAPADTDTGDTYAVRLFRAARRYVAADLAFRDDDAVDVSFLYEAQNSLTALQHIGCAS